MAGEPEPDAAFGHFHQQVLPQFVLVGEHRPRIPFVRIGDIGRNVRKDNRGNPAGFDVVEFGGQPLVLRGGLFRRGFPPELGIDADQLPPVDQGALPVRTEIVPVPGKLFGGHRIGNIVIPRCDDQLRLDPFQPADHLVDRIGIAVNQIAQNRHDIGIQVVDQVDRLMEPAETRPESLFAEPELRIAVLHQPERFRFKCR